MSAAVIAFGPAAAMPARTRIDFMDSAKAIGIVLVVIGHTLPEGDVATLIYSFHMPLFFFISGYLRAAERFAMPLHETVRRAARSLLVPYAFFFALSFAYWLATRDLGARSAKFQGIDAADALMGLLTGVSSDLFVNVALWFFPCMFVCQVVFAALRRRISAGALLLALGGLATALLALRPAWEARWPWGLDIVWIAIVFYAAGHWLRDSGRLDDAAGSAGVRRWATACALAACWLALARVQGRVDLAQAHFGAHPLLYLPCAMCGVGFVVAIARLCPPTRLSRRMADDSIVIFPLHPLLINFASGLVQLSGQQAPADLHGLGWCACATVWGIGASLPVATLLRRHLPVALGLGARPPLRERPW
jgi:acyltransferase